MSRFSAPPTRFSSARRTFRTSLGGRLRGSLSARRDSSTLFNAPSLDVCEHREGILGSAAFQVFICFSHRRDELGRVGKDEILQAFPGDGDDGSHDPSVLGHKRRPTRPRNLINHAAGISSELPNADTCHERVPLRCTSNCRTSVPGRQPGNGYRYEGRTFSASSSTWWMSLISGNRIRKSSPAASYSLTASAMTSTGP